MMDITPFSLPHILFAFSPEGIILLSLIILFLVDLIEDNSIWLVRISWLGPGIATSLLIYQCINPIETQFLGNCEVTKVTTLFRTILTLSAVLCVLISKDYVQCAGMKWGEFGIFLLTATLGAMFLCGAKDLITIFVCFECLSLSSYLLAGYSKQDIRSNEAAMKYLLVGGLSSGILAYGFSWLYGLSGGHMQLTEIALGLLEYPTEPLAVGIAFSSTLVGLAFKLSAVPFHQWTPDVYEGSPTPVVAFLSVSSKTAALALTTRIFHLVFLVLPAESEWLVQLLAIASMVAGNSIALTQLSMKRMLAYSSVSQAGYLLIATLSVDSYGYDGMILYLVIYLFMNLGAFACAILLGLRTGTDQIRDYRGLCFKDPWLSLCLSLCLLSLAGFPPLAGFFSKLYVFWYAWQRELYFLVYVGLFTSVISMYYYLRIVKLMLSPELSEISSYIEPYPLPRSFQSSVLTYSSLEIGIVVCALGVTLLGFALDPILGITHQTLATDLVVRVLPKIP